MKEPLKISSAIFFVHDFISVQAL